MVLTASNVEHIVPVQPENIPDVLKHMVRWLNWRAEDTKGDGKLGKVPVQPRSPQYRASKTNPQHWSEFRQAVEACGRAGVEGLTLATGDGVWAMDIDGCVDPVTREMTPEAEAIVRRLPTYWEFSPSGTGLRAIALGDLPGPTINSKVEGAEYEMIGNAGAVTITGAHLPGTATDVADCSQVAAALYQEAKEAARRAKDASLPKLAATASRVTADQTAGRLATPFAGGLSDDEVLETAYRSEKAHEIKTLMAGEQLSHHPSRSESDQALANHLAFFCGGHGHQQIERIMRNSGCMRDKFDAHPDYLKDTIAKAIASKATFYDPSYRSGGQTTKTTTERNLSREATGNKDAPKPKKAKKHAPELPNGIPSTGPACLTDDSTLTDIGLARRLTLEARDTLRYCREQRAWLAYTGKRYEADDGMAAMAIGKKVADKMWHEYADAPQTIKDRTQKFLKAASSSHGIEAAVKLARSEPGVVVTAAELDTHPYLLNCKNGTLDLLTLTLRPHSPADLLTHLANVGFDATAKAPAWRKFVADVCGNDKELMGFMQRSCGLALSGDVSEQHLWLHYGVGRNGKSTLISVLSEMLGTYAGPAPLDMLLVKNRGKEVETQFASLAGKRLVTAVETDAGVRFSEATVKQLTGGDIVQARRLYENPWPLKPSWKLHIACNHRPAVRGRDEGIWRRLLTIPWLQQFDGEREDKKLKDKLLAELPGVLAWCVAGFAMWREDGLKPPASLREAAKDYRSENDVLGTWQAECCVVSPGAIAEFGSLYRSFAAWCNERGEHCGSSIQFGKDLDRLGYAGERHNAGPWRNRTVRRGIGLLDGLREGEL